jgi:aspartyl-tRNA(Asn)/glutamyl-tRNA(Gln) amidotransferase subunit C
MEINDATIDKIAGLARLKFNTTEKEDVKKGLQNMIGLIEKMNELNTDNVEPLLFMNDTANVVRADVLQGSVSNEAALQNAAHTKAPHFIVPTIIKK